MTFLKALLIVLVVLWLLSRIRLGGRLQYREGSASLKVLVGPIRITVLPARKKNKSKKQKKEAGKKRKPSGKSVAQDGIKKKPKLPPITELLFLAAEAAGRLKRKIRIDELTLHLTWASDDPAETAIGFGRAHAAMGMVWPLIENNFNVRKHDLGVAVDFNRDKPEIACDAALTMTVGQLVAFGVRFGVKLLVMLSRSGKDSEKKQEA